MSDKLKHDESRVSPLPRNSAAPSPSLQLRFVTSFYATACPPPDRPLSLSANTPNAASHPSAGGGRGGVGERIARRQSKYFHFQHSSAARMHECRCLHDKQLFGSGVGGDLHLAARRSRCAAHFHFLASVCSLTAGSLECETPKKRAEAGRCAELRCVQGPAQADGPNGNSKGSDVLRLPRVFQPVPQVASLLST